MMDKALMERAAKRVMDARIDVMLSDVFFGALLARLEMQPASDTQYMATDGKRLRYNAERIVEAPMGEIVAVLKHEVLHCALGHVWRREGRDREVWNRAADHAANLLLKASGVPVGADWLCDPRFTGQSAERIYSALRQEQQEQQQQEREEQEREQEQEQQDEGGEEGGEEGDQEPQDGPGEEGTQEGGSEESPSPPEGSGQATEASSGTPDLGPGAMDDPVDDEDGQGGDALASEWQAATVQATMLAQAWGQNPGGFKSAIEAAGRARADLPGELRRFVSEISRNDYCWAKPSPRYMASGMYLPSLRDESLGPIVIVRDTSGSITDRVVQQFNAEISAVLGESRPSRTIVLDADTRVASAVEIERGDPMPESLREAYGRGGTDFSAAFRWVEETMSDEPPAALVYLTDMHGGFPEVAPDYPVLWVSIAGISSAPFGEVIAVSDVEA